MNFKVVITMWKRDSCHLKSDRIGRTGSCGLVLLKHQVKSKQAVKQRCGEMGCQICCVQADLGIQASRLTMDAADSFKKSFMHCMYRNMLLFLQCLCWCGWLSLVFAC